MKTATITLHSAHNNGSFLQSFALQRKIISMGYDNEIINYIPPAQYSLYQNIIFKDSSFKGVIKGLLNLPRYSALLERKNRFNEAQSFLKKTKKFEDISKFKKIVSPFDVLVAGSDQIWNIATMPDFTSLYLLPSEKYKISYAPSFGKSLKNQFDNPILIKSISEINQVSIREKSAQVELKSRLPYKDIEVVLDPTFLLDKTEYEILVNKSNRKYKGDYIFFYCIKATSDVLKTVKLISKKLGLPVVTVFSGVSAYKCQMFGQKVDFEAGPSEFVDYIKNAKYVISNSFHGIVFSIIYEKIFYRIADNEHGKIKVDERLDSILELLGLTKQNIIAGSEFILNKDIDYLSSNKKLDKLKGKSTFWLENSFKLAENMEKE